MDESILSLTAQEALDFMLKPEQYHGFELPEYFDFTSILQYVRASVGEKTYDECLTDSAPDELEDINVEILLSKDGHYGVRQLILANPFLYYFLARELCSQPGWEAMQGCFQAYHVPHITAAALPIVPDKKKVEPFHKSTTILHWWNSVEQRSIALSLEYKYMFITDISNCYGSVNPQSIEWALTCKGTDKEMLSNRTLARNVQKYLRAMQHGRNVGIPQGSALFDFVAEIILGYADLLLHEKLEDEKIKSDYEIIRYRDDYRIFCNDKHVLERISYILQDVLGQLNFRMNAQKTRLSSSIVTDAVKPEKLWYILNTPIYSKSKGSYKTKEKKDDKTKEYDKTKGYDFDGIQKHLFFILQFARKYPNCGQIKTLLSNLDKLIQERLQAKTITLKGILKGKKIYGSVGILEDKRVLSAIATQIAEENVSAAHYALRIITRVVNSLEDDNEKRDIITKVYRRLHDMPNSEYNQLWLQNITYAYHIDDDYKVRLCSCLKGSMQEPLWNNTWLKPELTEAMPCESIINKETLKKVTPVLEFRERRAYDEYLLANIHEDT